MDVERVMAVMEKRDPSPRSSVMMAAPTFPPGYIDVVRYRVTDEVI